MPNTPGQDFSCDICGTPVALFNASQCSYLGFFKHPYKFLCIDCLPEIIDKVTKWPYLFRHCSRN